MLQWVRFLDDQPTAAGGTFEAPGSPPTASLDLTDLLESECEAHCLCPPPGLL